MKNDIMKPVEKEAKLFRWRTVFTWALLGVFALSALQVNAIYHRNTIRGPRNNTGISSSSDRSKIQPTSSPNIVGTLVQNENGNVTVEWPLWMNGETWFNREVITLGQYKSEADFLKVYIEKCKARDGKQNDKRVMGAEYERKRVYMAAGKKMWAAHLKVLQATRAAEKKFLQGLPLESLFGIKIGKPVDLALYEKLEDDWYVFKPARQFRKFDTYLFRVTPKSHTVYQIMATSGNFAEPEKQDEEWNFVKQVFMKKFQKQTVKDLPGKNGYLLLFPGAGAGVEREIVIRRSGDSASIVAVDSRLSKLAEEERTSTAAKSITPPANDVDAL